MSPAVIKPAMRRCNVSTRLAKTSVNMRTLDRVALRAKRQCALELYGYPIRAA
jgi:hypothetical protein